ncbi:ROK family transcriptional regulator [Endozoicomonas ascidiicola]|uniref:ROK family transcriptional regulator n=1 Tax=Endozoicomonas ascidiicola TaxID=1698521 RepID=UPI0008365576|nr:ROK family transcriptional regulator [Endozoicomonas ascidiicola]
MTSVIANLDFVKERNVSAVYKAIVEHGSISRIQIARQCRLAAGSVTRITRQLMDAGLIVEQEQQTSERGRRATSLAPAQGQLQILAARAGRTRLHIGLCDISGKLLAKYSEPLHPHSENEFTEQLLSALKTFLRKQKKQIRCLAGVGITTPGLVNSATGIVTFMPHLSVHNLPLAEHVSNALGIPCYINNFIASMALAEHHFGVTRNVKNSLLVSVHNGVGAGMILDGKLYEGSTLAVGEIGHIQIEPLGARCYCGNFGCLETLVSNSAIEERCHKLLASGVPSTLKARADMTAICKAANKGDKLATDLLKEAAGNLGRAIAMGVNLLRPDKVVLAGEMCQAFDVIHPVIKHCLHTQTVSVNPNLETDVVCSSLYDSPWYGGFTLVRKALLQDGLILKYIH